MTASIRTGKPSERDCDFTADREPSGRRGPLFDVVGGLAPVVWGSTRSWTSLPVEAPKPRRRRPIAGVPVLAGIALVAAIALAPAGRANASPADNSRSSGADSFTATGLCSDAIRVDSSWDVVIHTYYDASGTAVRLAFTGTTRITYTDLANGNSYSPNSSGPGTVDLTSGASWVRGSNGAVFNDAGVLVSTDGRIVYDSSGAIVRISGHQTPVCEALGAKAAAL